MRANIPLPNSVASLCGRGSDFPCNAVDRHGVAVCLSEDMQGSAFGLGIKLRPRFGVRQPATHVRKEWQTYAGQVGGIAARSVSHWLASCELLRINCDLRKNEYEIISVFLRTAYIFCALRITGIVWRRGFRAGLTCVSVSFFGEIVKTAYCAPDCAPVAQHVIFWTA